MTVPILPVNLEERISVIMKRNSVLPGMAYSEAARDLKIWGCCKQG